MFRLLDTLPSILLVSVAALAPALLAPNSALADVVHVDNTELARLVAEGATIVDVRRRDEWEASGVLPGSHPLTFFDKQGRYDIDRWLSDLSAIAGKDEQIVLVCAHGVRSRRIADLLDSRLGYSAVHNVRKGMEGWRESGGATVPFSDNP